MMSLSMRRPTSRFQPGMAAMYACTGALPSPFAICGLPPERSFGLGALRLAPLLLATFPEFLALVIPSPWTPMDLLCPFHLELERKRLNAPPWRGGHHARAAASRPRRARGLLQPAPQWCLRRWRWNRE